MPNCPTRNTKQTHKPTVPGRTTYVQYVFTTNTQILNSIDISRKGVALNESCYPYKQIDCFWSVSPFPQKELQHLCCKELPTDAAEDHPLHTADLFIASPYNSIQDILPYIIDFKIHFFWLLSPKFT